MGFLSRWVGRPIKLTDGSFWRGFFGLDTDAGVVVDYDKALSLDAVWSCANIIAKAVGTLPCVVYKEDGVTPDKGGALYELLHDLPNADDTATEFWGMAAMCLVLDGNFFAEKKMSGERLVALNPLHPLSVEVERNARGGRVFVITEKGKQRRVGEGGMLHVRMARLPGCDRGMSPISMVRNTIGNAIAAEKSAGKMFANGMQVAGVLTSDQVLNPDQRAQLGNSLQQFAGSDRAGKIAVLEAGLKYQQLTVNPQDAQMLETRKFGVEQICRIFGVPPVMIGHAAEGVTTWGSGVEQLILQFTKTGLRPLLKTIESAVYRDLLDAKTRKTTKVEFNMEGLLRGDSQTRAEFLSKMVGAGIYTINEARAYENKPDVDGGGQLLVNSTMLPVDKLGADRAPQGTN